MGIFTVPGTIGQIKTTSLSSGDMAVSGPSTGPLEQVMFDACRWSGRRNEGYGGWIIPSASVSRVLAKLRSRANQIAS